MTTTTRSILHRVSRTCVRVRKVSNGFVATHRPTLTSSFVNERCDLKKFLKILHTLPSQSLHVNTRVLTLSNVQNGIGVGDLDTMFRSCHEVVEFGFVRRGGTCDRALMFE